MKTSVTCHSVYRRNALIEIYAPLVPAIASRVARQIPATFDIEDLQQVGRLAILQAAPQVESYLRTRVRGAMLDSIKGCVYREVMHLSIADVPEPVDYSQPDLMLIDEETALRVNAAVATLPEHLSAAIARIGERQVTLKHVAIEGRRRGRPRKADVAAEAEALGVMRAALARAA